MKSIITTLVATSLFATLAATAQTESKSRVVNQGRAGYAVLPRPQVQYPPKRQVRTTTVALATEKPQQPATRLQIVGRAGYQAMPTHSR
jgi:hypothetical protein